VSDDYFFRDLHPETEAAYRAAITMLGEIGFELRDVSLPGFEASEKASAKILLAEAAAYHREHIEKHADQIGTDVLTRFKWGLEVTGVEYALARRTQVEWRHKMTQLFESIDALVLPATPFPATPIEESDPVALSRGNLTLHTYVQFDRQSGDRGALRSNRERPADRITNRGDALAGGEDPAGSACLRTVSSEFELAARLT
jgi:Asp-tRNA(Asn)/Glu-tRNA(Gln) amidotransferase A subunit family amidase